MADGRRGPPKGSKNALKNGKHLAWRRLVVGELPTTMASVKREARAYRTELEEDVKALYGTVDTVAAHLIDTASAATVQAGICRWLLRRKLNEMSVSDIRGCTADIVKAKERRDNAIKALNLSVDTAPKPPWELLPADENK